MLYISPSKNGSGKAPLRSPDTEMKYLKMNRGGVAETQKKSPYAAKSPLMQFPDIKYQSSVVESVPNQE